MSNKKVILWVQKRRKSNTLGAKSNTLGANAFQNINVCRVFRAVFFTQRISKRFKGKQASRLRLSACSSSRMGSFRANHHSDKLGQMFARNGHQCKLGMICRLRQICSSDGFCRLGRFCRSSSLRANTDRGKLGQMFRAQIMH